MIITMADSRWTFKVPKGYYWVCHGRTQSGDLYLSPSKLSSAKNADIGNATTPTDAWTEIAGDSPGTPNPIGYFGLPISTYRFVARPITNATRFWHRLLGI